MTRGILSTPGVPIHPCFPMNELPESLPLTYQVALREHVTRPCKATLRQASALGRAAVDGGLGISDLIGLHHQALAECTAADGHSVVSARFAPALDSFLMQALSPFEVADFCSGGVRERRLRT